MNTYVWPKSIPAPRGPLNWISSCAAAQEDTLAKEGSRELASTRSERGHGRATALERL